MLRLFLISFAGGWLSGAFGISGGLVYNPCLLSLGVNPQVAGATSMYLVMFTALNSCIVNFQEIKLSREYEILLGVLAICTTVLSLFI